MIKQIAGAVIGMLFLFPNSNTYCQSTYARVYTILQTHCADAGCHGVSPYESFSLAGSQNDVYNQIVNGAVANPVASQKSHVLISPGYPHRSFLLRKIASDMGNELVLETGEGTPCPKNGVLTAVEKELVRQWIMFGAPKSGTVISEATLIDYYSGKALPEIDAPPPPPPGEGFQVHDGPLFLLPGQEREYQWKYNTLLPEDVEVTKVEVVMSPQSHHYILYKYHPGYGSNVAEGHQRITSVAGQADVQINASTIATWQYSRPHELPEGTAYFWEASTILNSNFHIKNYDDDSILAAHAYLNVYTRPRGSGAVEMFSRLAVYGGLLNPFALHIPNTGANHTLSFEQTANETWYIWILQAHTHKLGVDYDIYLRNADGSRGVKIYEGTMDYEAGFDRGYYDWAHPPVREFAPLLEVDMREGLIHEATYFNDGPSDVGFGITTNDEMFITYMHYTKALPVTGIPSAGEPVALQVKPNPSEGWAVLEYALQEADRVNIELIHMDGRQETLLHAAYQTPGRHFLTLNQDGRLIPGLYWIKLTGGKHASTVKVVIQ
ncbi:MAG: hypothetical protein KatS3mg031_0892 [Chitinophagales bacterium]|nr:MAG: hypothetical protein KatS3mg031_0892 [Chitinophagales bacterium]